MPSPPRHKPGATDKPSPPRPGSAPSENSMPDRDAEEALAPSLQTLLEELRHSLTAGALSASTREKNSILGRVLAQSEEESSENAIDKQADNQASSVTKVGTERR